MVGIHALSIAKFVSFAPCPTEPNWARSANRSTFALWTERSQTGSVGQPPVARP